MDYSLLIGIHDCTLPGPAEEYGEEEWLEEDNNGYISSDDIGEPLSPQGTCTSDASSRLHMYCTMYAVYLYAHSFFLLLTHNHVKCIQYANSVHTAYNSDWPVCTLFSVLTIQSAQEKMG